MTTTCSKPSYPQIDGSVKKMNQLQLNSYTKLEIY